MKNKNLFFLTVCLFLGLVLLITFTFYFAKPTWAQKRKEVVIELYGQTLGKGGYVHCFALSDLINKHSDWLRCTVIESDTAGSIATLQRYPKKKSVWIGYSNPLSVYLCEKGNKPCAGPFSGLKLLASAAHTNGPFATLDPDIKTYKDIIGKRVGVGRHSSSIGFLPEFVIEYGWGIKDKVKLINLSGYGKIKDALLDGTIDVGYLGTQMVDMKTKEWIPNPATAEVMAQKKVYWIPISEEAMAKAREASGYPMERAIFPPRTVAGQKVETPVIGIYYNNGWWCHESMDDDVVREVCRIIWEYTDKFPNYGNIGRTVTKASVTTAAVPESTYHRASISFFHEMGVKKLGLHK
jgi:TRAP-type uncharacterized transport system substrate-binding protein